jgi:mRNA-degrading endonuclease RelE of RelBE toxin-antitoxin system
MYNLKFSSEFLKELQVLDSRYPGISNKIKLLSAEGR